MGNRIVDQENKMVEDILENFDFEKCRKAMKALNWTWAFEGDIPSIERLKKAAENRLKDSMELAKKGSDSKFTYFVSSGGLKGNAWRNRYGHIEGIRLEFILTDWDADGDV